MSNLSSQSTKEFSQLLSTSQFDDFPIDDNLARFDLSGTSTNFDNKYGLSSIVTEINENYINFKRIREYQRQFSNELVALLRDSDFEYGIRSKVDILVQEKMRENAFATKAWLNQIFIEHFDDVPVLLGILRVVARLNYFQIYPEGPIMAVAALSHKNDEVQECGIRAFESWETLESYNVLVNLKGKSEWLQDYIDRIVDALRRKFNV